MPSVNLDKSYRVVYMHIKNTDHRLFEFVPLFKYVIMWIKHMLLMYGTCDGITFVFNNDGLSWRHVLKLPMRITHTMLQFLEVFTWVFIMMRKAFNAIYWGFEIHRVYPMIKV